MSNEVSELKAKVSFLEKKLLELTLICEEKEKEISILDRYRVKYNQLNQENLKNISSIESEHLRELSKIRAKLENIKSSKINLWVVIHILIIILLYLILPIPFSDF